MVHAITSLKCNKGHTLPISFDSNECGCHHKGKPCIIVNCRECLREYLLEKRRGEREGKTPFQVTIPLDEDGMEEIKKLQEKEGK